MLSPLEARNLAETWAQSQSDLYEGWRIASTFEKNHLFNVTWTHPEYKVEFTLIKARIVAGGTIEVLNDRREQVKDLLSRSKGFKREAQFFQAVEFKTPTTPQWLKRVLRSGPGSDRMGIDGWGQIEVDGSLIKLPFQIKSSRWQQRRFFKERPAYIGIVGVIIVESSDSDDTLRHKLYSCLGMTRSKMLREGISIDEMKRRITAAWRSKRNPKANPAT